MDVTITVLLAVVTALLGWVGFAITAVLKGGMVPKVTHEREIQILKERLSDMTVMYEKRLSEIGEEKAEWRAASQVDQSVAQEERMQKRMLLEQGQTTTYALESIRTALNLLAGKDAVS